MSTENYGFILAPASQEEIASGITDDQRFMQGLFCYANRNKGNAQYQQKVSRTFGDNLPDFPDPKYEHYWVGSAILNRMGATSDQIGQVYASLELPMPSNSNTRELTEYLGEHVLANFSADYDKQQKIIKERNTRLQANYSGLINGTKNHWDIKPDEIQDIQDAYGLSAADIALAGELARIQFRTLSDINNVNFGTMVKASAKDFVNVSGKLDALGELFKGNVGRAIRISSPESYKLMRRQAYQLGDKTEQIKAILSRSQNPKAVQDFASHLVYDQRSKKLANASGFEKFLYTADEVGYSLYSGLQTYIKRANQELKIENEDNLRSLLHSGLPIDSDFVLKKLNKETEDNALYRQAQAAQGALTAAQQQADADADTSDITKGFQLFLQTAPYLNAFTAALSSADLFKQNANTSYATIQDKDGYVTASEDAMINFKAGADAAINWGTRAIPIKYAAKPLQAALNKVASKANPFVAGLVKNPLTTYAAHSAWTAIQFATVVPAMDASLRASYEAALNVNPELRTGYKSLLQLQEQLQQPSYYAQNMVIGALLGLAPTIHHHRIENIINKNMLTKGLSKNEVRKTSLHYTLPDRAKELQTVLDKKMQENPAQVIKDAAENTKTTLTEEQQEAVDKLGKGIILDEAKRASLRRLGIEVLDSENPDKVIVTMGGDNDPLTNEWVPGTKPVEIDRETAGRYFAAIYDHNLRLFTDVLRNALGKKTLLDALKDTLRGMIGIKYLAKSFDFNKVIETGNKALSARDKAAKDIREQSKTEDGSYTISEADALAQAGKTIDPSLHKTRTLDQLINYGKEADSRRQYEVETNASVDPDASFLSNVYVLTKSNPLSPDSIRRIFMITRGASFREVAEDLGEQYLKDYMFETGTDITDAWRTLQEVEKYIKDDSVSLTRISKSHPELAQRLKDGLTTGGNISPAEFDLIRRDVVEGFSKLLLSNLREAAANDDGSLPPWVHELVNASFLTGHLMQQEMILAAAVKEAEAMGLKNEAMKRLLNVAPDKIKSILNKKKNPKQDEFWDAYQQQKKIYENILAKEAQKSPEEVDAWMKGHADAAEQLNAEQQQEEEERSASFAEAVKEAESLPENQGKSHEQIVEEVNAKAIDAKEKDIAAKSTDGKHQEIRDENGLVCRVEMVELDSLSMMPNFKSGADKDTGEVAPLTGDYNPDHDPIRVLRTTDGKMLVISGRHRLAHAKRYNAKKIIAYIYDETPEHNLAWARYKDVEWNIKDNQATPLDIALIIRGELVDGIAPLTQADCLRMGIVDSKTGKPRNGSQAALGYAIGTNASAEVMTQLRNGNISTSAAVAISLASTNPDAQRKGLQAALNGTASRDLPSIVAIEQSRLDYLNAQGDTFQADWFGTLDTDTPYSKFVESYALNQIKAKNAIIKGKEKTQQIAKSKNADVILENSPLQLNPDADPNAVKADIQKDKADLAAWEKPWLNMDIIGKEIDDAFAKEHPEEWAKMQAERKAQEDARAEIIDFAISPLPGLHASAHEFDKFDTAYMGTGEGAQAYGWGLYFAENWVINKWYFDQFNREHTTLIHKIGSIESNQEDFITTVQNIFNKNATESVTPQQLTRAIYSLMSGRFVANWSIDREIDFLTRRVDGGNTKYKPILNALKDIRDAGLAVELKKQFAINYKVALNCSKDDLFSWDDSAPADIVAKARSLYEQKVGKQKALSFFNEVSGKNDTVAGSILYNRVLVPALGNPKAASMWLYDQGYKGIKHLDATSRKGKKNPTHNFIIFKNEDIKITAINRTGKWSTTEGWEPFTDTTAEFSVFSSTDAIQEWQLDPTAGLGSLGHFADNIERKLAPVGDDETDARFAKLQAFIKRRQLEIQNLNGEKDLDILVGEIMSLPQLVNTLPFGYRFSLEPYIQFLTTYANLIKNADPERAGAALPMSGWDKVMGNSFRKAFARMFNENMTAMEQMEFEQFFSPFIALTDIQSFRTALEQAREDAALKFDIQHAEELNDPAKRAELRKQRKEAQEEAVEKVMEENADIRDAMYKAIGQMRASRLVDKLLARVYLKMEQYRKDRTLAKISRALSSITPRKQKNGKPVKGTVSQETYDTALKAYRLLLLTKSEKDIIDAEHPDLAEKSDDSTLDIITFDHDGKEIKLQVTKQEYETYACLAGMTADHAASTAKTLGTLIASGKQAWQLVADQQKERINQFCDSIYNEYAENENQRIIRAHKETTSNFEGKGVTKSIKRMLAGVYNDAQLIDLISNVPGLQNFRDVQKSIADAHNYLLKADKENGESILSTALSIIGHHGADILKLSRKQKKDLRDFFNEINDIKQLPAEGKDTLTLTKQAPDFVKQHSNKLRHSLLKRLNQYTRTKNYDANLLAAAVQKLVDDGVFPEDFRTEVINKYGKDGNAALYFGDLDKAIETILPATKFGHLRDFNKTVEERAAKSLLKWQTEHGSKNKPVTFTEITRNEAAYRVLLCEQPDLAEALRLQGYTPEVVAKLKKIAGEEMMQFAYALRDILNQRQPILKEIYETTYGTPFPTVENYFRAFFDAGTKEANDSQLENIGFGIEGQGAGAMKIFYNRVKHNAPIMPIMSVTHAFQLAMMQQDNIIAYCHPETHQHLGEMLNRVLSDRRGDATLANCLKAAIGTEHYDALKKQVENMFRLHGHANGFDAALNRGMRDVSGVAAYTCLVYSWSSIAKNAMAYFNTLGGNADIGPVQWAKSAGRIAIGQGRITPEEIAKESFIADRFKGWDTDSLLEVVYQQAGVKSALSSATTFAKRGMSIYGKLDRYFTAKSAAIIYDAYYRHLETAFPDMTHEARHIESLKAAQQALNLRSQPMDWKQRPLTAAYNSWKSAAYFFLGGEAWNTLGNVCRLISESGWRTPQARKALANAAAVWLVHGALFSAVNLALNFVLDDDEHWEKRNIWASMGWGTLLGPIAGMPIISNLAAASVNFFGSDYYVPTPSYMPMQDLAMIGRDLKKIFSEKSSAWDKSIAVSNTLRNLLFFTLLGTTRAKSPRSAAIQAGAIVTVAANNAVNYLLRIGRAIDERIITPVPEALPKNINMPKYLRKAHSQSKKSKADDMLRKFIPFL